MPARLVWVECVRVCCEQMSKYHIAMMCEAYSGGVDGVGRVYREFYFKVQVQRMANGALYKYRCFIKVHNIRAHNVTIFIYDGADIRNVLAGCVLRNSGRFSFLHFFFAYQSVCSYKGDACLPSTIYTLNSYPKCTLTRCAQKVNSGVRMCLSLKQKKQTEQTLNISARCGRSPGGFCQKNNFVFFLYDDECILK